MCASSLPPELCAGIIHGRIGRPLVVVMGEVGTWSVIFNHWRIQNFLAKGGRQTVGSRTVQSTSGHMEREMEQVSPSLTADLSSGTNVCPNLNLELMGLLNNQLLHPFDQVLIFEANVEPGQTNSFVCEVVPDLQVGVVLGLFVRDSFYMIKVEHPGQDINREGWHGG